MDLVTHGVLVVAAVCFTLGAINLRLWLGDRDRLDLLAMAAICLFGGAYALFELAWLHNVSTAEFGEIARWSQIASWGTVVSLAIFLRLHLHTGRSWLILTIFVLRTFGLCINFAMPVNIQYRELWAIEQITVLGEKLSYPVGVPNPWHIVQILSFVLLFAFALDSMVTVWRRGDRRRSLVFGGGVALMCLSTLALAGAVIWFSVKIPPFASPTLMFVIVGMAIEFDYDLRRSKRLASELTTREVQLTETLEQLNLSASAGQVGIWARDLGTDELWVNEKMRELFGFEESKSLSVVDYLAKIHPDDLETIKHIQERTRDEGDVYEVEYRIMLHDQKVRWMRSIGQVQVQNNGEKVLRGATVDITRRKLAEEAAHELSAKLMDAQEKERARLARELHDDLSQNLALLSIQLQSLLTPSSDGKGLKKQVEKLTGQIQRLSSDVHRISHELHPSKLNQLGLESALRGFCRESQEAHGLKIGFRAANVPRTIPNDVSLCLYRIAQEALQNVVKHSGASMANVVLEANDKLISLVISDNGDGFDAEAVRSKESLGLISMTERIQAVGGQLSVQSDFGSGTRIEAQIPFTRR